MTTAEDTLTAIQASVRRRNAEDALPCDHECVAVCPGPLGIDVDFWGLALGDSYAELAEALGTAAVAAALRCLTLRGPDEGANGTRNWDLTPLLQAGATFPRLESVTIQQNSPGDHNRSIIGASYEEEGSLARLLAAAPQLRALVTPSAPDGDFFKVGNRPVRYLSVDAGYAHQNFLLNLARSSCFPQLSAVAWGEYNETYIDDFRSHVTPFEHYSELFASQALARVRGFRLRNPVLTADELRTLRELRDRMFQFKVVRYSSEYIEPRRERLRKDA